MNGTERLYLEALFAAYSAVWVVMFGFLHRIDRRAARLERDLAFMTSQEALDVDKADSPMTGPSV